MANNGGIITAPVRLAADVKKVLGSSNNTLGTLCRSPLINKYAKYKPIKFASLGPITDAQRLSANHGFGTPKKMRIFYKDCDAPAWSQWAPPTGGNSEPYRLGDFNGYFHNAASFIKSITVRTSHQDGVSLIASPTEPGFLYADIEIEANRSSLGFSDFQINGRNFSDMYLHAAIFPLEGANLNNDSAVHGEFYNIYELGSGTVSFTLQTAPNSAFYNRMASDQVAALVIGITEYDINSQATEFWSPVIFSEWGKFKWITEYTSFKTNNGIVVVQDMYFKGGMSVYPTLELRMSDDLQCVEIHITGMFVFLQQTDKSGKATTINGADASWCLINGELHIGDEEIRFSVSTEKHKGASSFEITDWVNSFDRGRFNTGTQTWRCSFTMVGTATIKPGTTTRVEYHLLGDYSESYKTSTYEQTGSINITK